MGVPADRTRMILSTLRTLAAGMSICLAISADVGSRPTHLDQLPRRANQLVDDLDHVHREADGARLIGNRSLIAWRIHHVA